jgi:hypothetical protein
MQNGVTGGSSLPPSQYMRSYSFIHKPGTAVVSPQGWDIHIAERQIEAFGAGAHATLPFMLVPSAERLEAIATTVLDYAVRSASGLPTLALKASGRWKATNPHNATSGSSEASPESPSKMKAPTPSHLVRHLPVNAREDVLQVGIAGCFSLTLNQLMNALQCPPYLSQMPSAEWLITGKQTQEWASADSVLPSLGLDHPQVAFARQLILEVVQDNAADAQVLAVPYGWYAL